MSAVCKGRHYVDIGEKQYRVFFHDDGRVSISTTWESIAPGHGNVWLAHPKTCSHSRSVSPHGKLGRKILAILKNRGKAANE